MVVTPTTHSITINNLNLVLNQNPQPGKLGDLSFKPGFKLDRKGLNILNKVPNII